MRFSACIEMLFTELPFIQRIKKAKDFGFEAIEFWAWQKTDFNVDKDLEKIKEECKKVDLKVSLFLGNWKNSLIEPSERDKCVEELKISIKVATEFGTTNINLLTNKMRKDLSMVPLSEGTSEQDADNNIISILEEVCPIAKKYGITMNIEPLNSIVDHMGTFINYSKHGFDLAKSLRKKGITNVGVLYDIYHMQIMEGNIINTIEDNIDLISFIHIGDHPGRHEPGTGEVNFSKIFEKIKSLKYDKYIGFEYVPILTTEYSLGSAKDLFKI